MMPISIDSHLARSLLPDRPTLSHKGDFGSALIIAGSRHYTGAAILCASAALRSGPGLVHAAIPESIYGPLAAALPEAIWEILPEEAGGISLAAIAVIKPVLEGKNAVLIGPGLGNASSTHAFLAALFRDVLPAQESRLPLVLDAEALRLLPTLPNWPEWLPPGCLLTPHPGEMAALTGLKVSEIQADRVSVARQFAQEWRQTVILKGAHTAVANPSGLVEILPAATSALAHGGSGDVLAGITVGLMTQGLNAWDAGRLAVYLHYQCAVLALGTIGHAASVLAGDLVKEIGRAFGSLQASAPASYTEEREK